MNREPRNPLKLFIHADLGKRYVPFLRRNIQMVREIYPTPLVDLSLALVNDRQMSVLHQQFMKLPDPTDVLTFPLDVNAAGKATSGEIVICVPYANRAAKQEGVPLENELLLYAVHGILHLSGLDDRTAPQYKRMHRIEDDILARLGVGPVFHPAYPVPASSGRPRARGKQ